MKCKEECPDDLTLNHARMRSKCAKAIEYGICRKWVQTDKLGLKFMKVEVKQYEM